MNQSITKKRLGELAKEFAYHLFNNRLNWREHDTGKSLLDLKAGESLEPGITFTGELLEVGIDGVAKPLSAETKEAMRAAHDNITGTQERWIDIPKNCSPEEAALACLIVEGALFRMGFKPFVFREISDLAEVSMDSGYSDDTLPDKVFLRTNVSGAIESVDFQSLSSQIDGTIDSLSSNWEIKSKNGRKKLYKAIEVGGTFPFLDQFMELYSKAIGLDELLSYVSAGKGGLNHCSPLEVNRHMILHEQAGYSFPRVAVELQEQLAQRFTQDMEIPPVSENCSADQNSKLRR